MKSSDNRTAQQSDPSLRPSKQGRRVLVGAAIAVLGVVGAIIVMTRGNRSDGVAESGSATGEFQVPSPPSVPMERLDDPSADGWPSEALSEDAKKQLKRLGKMILYEGKREEAALRQIVAEGFSFNGLQPERV